MTTTFETVTELTTIHCGCCGGTYAINERYRQQKSDTGGYWHCPYCEKSWGYGKSQIEQLKEQVAEKDRVIAAERARHDQTLAAKKEIEESLIAQRGVTTRIKNRVAKGVCPCCKRHFTNLHRHMESQHPEFSKEV